MSATMKEEEFSQYFGKCPKLYVSGRTFPVQQHYLSEAMERVAQGQLMQAVESGKISNNYHGKQKQPFRRNIVANSKALFNCIILVYCAY